MFGIRPISFWVFAPVLTLATPVCGTAQAGQPAPRLLSLQAAVDALVDKNLPVIAARYQVDLFRAQRAAAALKPSPTVVFSADQFTISRLIARPHLLIATDGNAAANTTYTIDVEKLVERGGKRELRISQADLQTAQAEAQLADELRRQTFDLKQAFLSALLARDNLRVYRENLRDFGRMQQLFAAQVQEGYTAGVDLRRLGLERVELQGNVGTAQLEYGQDVRDVLNLIGEGERNAPDPTPVAAPDGADTVGTLGNDDPVDDSSVAIEGDLDVTPLDVHIDHLRTLALAHRSDLRAAQLAVEGATEGVKLAEAAGVRDVTLGAQYARVGSDNSVGMAIGVPLSTRALAAATVAQAVAVRRQADARLQQTRAQVLTDVEKAFLAYQVSRERLGLFTGTVLRQAAEVRSIEQVAYREGEHGLLSYLDAQRTYNQTLVDYNEARHAFALSVYRLESATGTSAAQLAGTTSPTAPSPGASHDYP